MAESRNEYLPSIVDAEKQPEQEIEQIHPHLSRSAYVHDEGGWMVEYDQRSTAGEVMCMHVVYRGSHDVQDLGSWCMEAYAQPPHDRGVVHRFAQLQHTCNAEPLTQLQ